MIYGSDIQRIDTGFENSSISQRTFVRSTASPCTFGLVDDSLTHFVDWRSPVRDIGWLLIGVFTFIAAVPVSDKLRDGLKKIDSAIEKRLG
jgi:hypothetical protein